MEEEENTHCPECGNEFCQSFEEDLNCCDSCIEEAINDYYERQTK